MRRTLVLVLALCTFTCGSDDEGLERIIVDCSADDAICDEIGDAGCSITLLLVDEEGQVVGICGDVAERRVCTEHCETDGDCPDGWLCQLPEGCPGENTIRYCAPSPTELELQEIESCRADASPRVCGFF